MQRIELLKRVAHGARLYLSLTPWGAPVQGALLQDECAPNGHRLIPGTQVERLLRAGLLRRRGVANPNGETDLDLTPAGYVTAFGRRLAASMLREANGGDGDSQAPPATPASLPGDTDGRALPGYSFAFQPIVDVRHRCVVAYEAFVRGRRDGNAAPILRAVPPNEIHRFDDECRTAAMRTAARLRIGQRLHINSFVSEDADAQAALARTLSTAQALGFDGGRLVLESKVDEIVERPEAYARRMQPLRELGMGLALSEIGGGLAGANLVAAIRPDYVKLGRRTALGTHVDARLRELVPKLVQTCRTLGVGVIAEAVETVDEYHWLRNAGVEQFQGNLFAPPTFEAVPPAQLP